MGSLGKSHAYALIIMNIKSALIAPVLLPYIRRAMNVSTNPAMSGDIIKAMLNPKITKCHITQIMADKKPTPVPINIAAIAQRFSIKKFTADANNFIPFLFSNRS